MREGFEKWWLTWFRAAKSEHPYSLEFIKEWTERAWQAAHHEEQRRITELYAAATTLSMKAGQVVGKKSAYYLTLQQLESLLVALEEQ